MAQPAFKSNKFIVGLTGGIGSGKTTVANLFAELGVPLVDADIVARQVVLPNTKGLTAIVQRFGQQILLEDGQLNRATLRDIIFTQPEQRLWLNELLHPLIRNQMLEEVQQADFQYVIMVVPLLFENGLDRLVHSTLVVDISPELQLSRTVKRDSVSQAQIQNIIDSQLSREQRLSKADYIIDNQGDLSKLSEDVNMLHLQFLAQAKSYNLTSND